jgi:hypothetical protein
MLIATSSPSSPARRSRFAGPAHTSQATVANMEAMSFLNVVYPGAGLRQARDGRHPAGRRYGHCHAHADGDEDSNASAGKPIAKFQRCAHERRGAG